MDWKNIYLKKDPFSLVPDYENEDLPWAGFKKTKQQLNNVFRELVNNENSKLVLNISRWGGGKTHAAHYYSRSGNLNFLDEKKELPDIYIINTPREGKNAAEEFYQQVLEDVGISNICKRIELMREKEGEDTSKNKLQKWSKSEDLGRILWLCGDKNEELSFQGTELLFNKPRAKQRRELRVRRGIESDSDRFLIISALIKIVATYGTDKKYENPRRVILWLDEIESLIYYSSKQYKPFTQALRELIDNSPKYFGLFLNFSFSEDEDVSTLEWLIGSALLDRVNDQINFGEASIDEALMYVEELFKFYRTNNYDSDNKFYPFTKESLKVLLETGKKELQRPLLPRTINHLCKKAINEANDQDIFKSSDKEISASFVGGLSFYDDVFE